MIEKRFTFADGFKIVAIRDNGEIMNSKQVCNKLNELAEENEQLKKALWCIRKRYGYTIEEFVEDLKDNGTDLSRVDLK